MKLDITGLVGLSRLTLDIDKICLITGVNGVGKTSIADALGATLTGEPLIRGLKYLNKTAGVVKDGHKRAVATLSNGDAFTKITWPKNEVETEGKPPRASAIASGRERFVGMALLRRHLC